MRVLISGAGLAIAGCAGTTVVAMARGKIDAVYCFIGFFGEGFYQSGHQPEILTIKLEMQHKQHAGC